MPRPRKQASWLSPAPDEADKAVGTMVKAIREHLNIKADDVAGLLKIGSDELKKSEDGKRLFSASELWAIAKHFKVPVQTLFLHIELDIDRIDNILRLVRVEGEICSILYACRDFQIERLLKIMKEETRHSTI